uniref:RING-type E3 ubiquitin transferase n=1 Tax=Davidia involucrata TaxID=16924 RepID=A0A5B6ZL94_DAVIN
MPWIQSQIKQRDGLLTRPFLFPLLSSSLSSSSSSPSPSLPSTYQKESTPSSSSGSKINPAVLFIIVILAVIFFISGLLHLLVRFLIKHRSSSSISQSNRYPEMSPSDAFQRQLRQLFHLHDSGLDQAYIDALPLFHYREVMGLKEPFDCAVCLCEFSEQDNLRLLPLCSHAFHIDCIDTWLLSNSTCPLCRGTLFSPGFSIENPVFDFDDSREEDGFSGNGVVGVSCGQKPAGDEIVSEKRVFPVRLGKFRSTNAAAAPAAAAGGSGGGGVGERGEGESSSSNLDARRCYSMGSFQYVVANSNLQVALCPSRANGDGGADVRIVKEGGGHNGNSSIDGDAEAKKINIGSKGESFSVSKIWLWSKKGKFPSPSVNVSLPWTDRTQAA